MNKTLIVLYAEDDAALVKEALTNYATALWREAEELTELDERYERNDVILKAQNVQRLITDFE